MALSKRTHALLTIHAVKQIAPDALPVVAQRTGYPVQNDLSGFSFHSITHAISHAVSSVGHAISHATQAVVHGAEDFIKNPIEQIKQVTKEEIQGGVTVFTMGLVDKKQQDKIVAWNHEHGNVLSIAAATALAVVGGAAALGSLQGAVETGAVKVGTVLKAAAGKYVVKALTDKGIPLVAPDGSTLTPTEMLQQYAAGKIKTLMSAGNLPDVTNADFRNKMIGQMVTQLPSSMSDQDKQEAALSAYYDMIGYNPVTGKPVTQKGSALPLIAMAGSVWSMLK